MRKGNIANVKIEENKQKTVNVSQFEILLALEREIVEEKRSVEKGDWRRGVVYPCTFEGCKCT